MELIRLLEENGRAKYVEIAKKLGVSETAIRKRVRKLIKLGLVVRRRGYQGGYFYYLTLLGEAVVKKMMGGGSAGPVFGFENVGVYFVVDEGVDVRVLPFGFVECRRGDGVVTCFKGSVEGCNVVVYPSRRKVIVYPPALKSSDVSDGFARMVITAYRVGEAFIKRYLKANIVEYGLVGRPQFVSNDSFAEYFY